MNWFDDADGLAQLRREVSPQRVVIDTEYDTNRRFEPRLALVQVAWDGGEALIDPLEVDLGLLDGWADTWVSHDGTHDWYFLARAGMRPPTCLDSQVAARLLALPSIGLAGVCAELLELELDKSEQRSDWLRRPLTTAQRDYAMGDVVHLRSALPVLESRVEAKGLGQAWREESALVLARAMELGERSPRPFTKVKKLYGAGALAYGRAQVLLDWRFEEAQRRDVPEHKVISNGLIPVIAAGRKTVRERDLVRRLKVAKPLEWPRRPTPEASVKERLSALKAWRQGLVEAHQIEASMVCPNGALERIAEGLPWQEEEALLGWRSRFFAEALAKLPQ